MAIKEERVKEIIQGIFHGKRLKELMPTSTELQNFYEFLAANAQYAGKYSLAQQARAEVLVDDLVEIADTEVDPQKARNRIDARKWVASKMQPHKYGDRIDLNINQHVDLSGALAEAAKRLLPSCYPEKVVEAQVIGRNELSHVSATDSESVEPPKPAQKESPSETLPDIFD